MNLRKSRQCWLFMFNGNHPNVHMGLMSTRRTPSRCGDGAPNHHENAATWSATRLACNANKGGCNAKASQLLHLN